MIRVIVLLLALFLGSCVHDSASRPVVKLANPASLHCGEVGGELRIEKMGNESEIGVCFFEDGGQCEEWALFRGECPVGGRSIKGFVTPGARYCAIRGGRIAMAQSTEGNETKQGLCTLPRGTVCDVVVLWQGNCG